MQTLYDGPKFHLNPALKCPTPHAQARADLDTLVLAQYAVYALRRYRATLLPFVEVVKVRFEWPDSANCPAMIIEIVFGEKVHVRPVAFHFFLESKALKEHKARIALYIRQNFDRWWGSIADIGIDTARLRQQADNAEKVRLILASHAAV